MVVRDRPVNCQSQHVQRASILSDDERTAFHAVLSRYVEPSFEVPGVDGNASLTKEEKMWLSGDCLLRYLRASNWDVDVAMRRLDATLKWRREYGISAPAFAQLVEPEAVTGKILLYGYDNDSRPSLYMLPSRENTDGPENQLRFTFFMIEKAIELMEPGVETLVFLLDFSDKAKKPSLGTARQMLSILQEHYPERLGRAMMINVPYLVNIFFRLVLPFIDPKTRTKLHFNPSVIKENMYDPSQVTTTWGGDVQFTYEHQTYWTELLAMTGQRMSDNLARWEKLGGTVGLSEWEIKGGGKIDEDKKADFAVPVSASL